MHLTNLIYYHFVKEETFCVKNLPRKVLQIKRCHYYLKKHIKIHEMNTRKSENYKVTHARTKRLEMSAIPQMQRILNNLEE